MFEKRVLCGIYGPKRDEATGGWRRYMTNLIIYTFLTIFLTIKTRRIKQVWHIVHIE
jgi:hypothetical protein